MTGVIRGRISFAVPPHVRNTVTGITLAGCFNNHGANGPNRGRLLTGFNVPLADVRIGGGSPLPSTAGSLCANAPNQFRSKIYVLID